MPNARVVREDHLQRPLKALCAAQYLRASTDSQKYSVENQAAAIAAYAARREIKIVATYADRGRSGVRIAGRDALKDLIKDVELGRAGFDRILVYDVSRWGRFQDVDESAYYEFICKRAGIRVDYCADEFENDGSFASAVLKNTRRLEAAGFSRQLSKKVFLGQSRAASEGYWRGGPAPYGLRRHLLDENGRVKLILQRGERKSLKTERTVLAPGPKQEIAIVQRIFELFANRKKTRTEIAAELNAKGIRNAQGKPWTMLTISNVLKNEAYLGHIVFNRRSMKLGESNVKNPPDMWIRHQNAFDSIISPALFSRAQQVMKELESGRTRTDKELLDLLKGLLRREGRLTMKGILMAKGMPNCSVYARRFGSLDEAYRRIGHKPATRYRFKEVQLNIADTIQSVAERIRADLESRGRRVSFMPELRLLTLNDSLTITIAVARAVKDGTNGVREVRRWEVRKIHFRRSDLTLVVRMTADNSKKKDYFLLPTANLPSPEKDNRIRISDRIFGEFRCADLDEVTGFLNNRLHGRLSAAHCKPLRRNNTNPADHLPPYLFQATRKRRRK
jgi:DNA invertase Pin-like site-specific DNA recombinase